MQVTINRHTITATDAGDYITMTTDNGGFQSVKAEWGDVAQAALAQFNRLQSEADHDRMNLWLALVAANGFESAVNQSDF